MRRFGAAIAATGLGWLLVIRWATPAGAVFTDNTINCRGHATIIDGNSETYEADAADAEVSVPRQGTVQYEGSIGTVTHNHKGEVRLMVGPGGIVVGNWGPAENAKNESSASGTRDIPGALAYVPPGSYDVTGFHQGDEGRCEGEVTVVVAGSPLASPVGLGVLTATVASGAALVFAGFARGRP